MRRDPSDLHSSSVSNSRSFYNYCCLAAHSTSFKVADGLLRVPQDCGAITSLTHRQGYGDLLSLGGVLTLHARRLGNPSRACIPSHQRVSSLTVLRRVNVRSPRIPAVLFDKNKSGSERINHKKHFGPPYSSILLRR